MQRSLIALSDTLVSRFHMPARSSEGVLGAAFQVCLHLVLNSSRVGIELGVLEKLILYKSEARALLVLQDVEGEAGQSKVSNCHFIADDEPGRGWLVELFLDNGEELSQDTIFPCSHLLGLLVVRAKEEGLSDRVEGISVGLNDHVNHSSSLPVCWIVIAKLDAKLTQDSIGLLAGLSTLVDDWHAAELSSVSCSLAATPRLLADLDLLVSGTLVVEEHDEGTWAGVCTREVLNLDGLPLRFPIKSTGWSSGSEVVT